METYTPKTPQEYWQIFLKRKKLFLILFLNILLAAVIAYPFIPRVYEATALVQVIDKKILNPHMKGLSAEGGGEKTLKTLTAEIVSWPNMLQLAKEFGLNPDAMSQEKFQMTVEGMRKRILVTMVSESLVEIAYQDRDPKKARIGANAIAKNVVSSNRQEKQKEAESAIEFIEQQLRIYKEKLKNSEQTFLLNKVNADLDEALKKRRFLQEQLSQMSQMNTQVVRRGNPQTFELRSELATTEAQLARLLTDAKKEHPMVRELRAKIEMLKKRIALEPPSFESTETSSVNSSYQDVVRKLKELDLDIGSLERKKADLASGKLGAKGVSQQDLVAIESDKHINEDIYQSLLRRLETAQIARNLDQEGKGATFKLVDPARLPLTPKKPNPLIVAIGSIGLAFMAGFGAVMLREYFDTSFRGYDDAKDYLKLPVLACIPTILPGIEGNGSRARADNGGYPSTHAVYIANVIKDPAIAPQIVSFHDPDSVPAEQYRLFRTHFLFMNEKQPMKTILVTSALEAEGKTSSSINIAISMAQELNRKVLLMDCDLRKGGVEKSLGYPQGKGLSNYLAGAYPLEAVVRKSRTENLSVMTAGSDTSASPTKLLGSEKMTKLMDMLRGQYDFIVMDAPPTLHLADVPVLAIHADGVVMVTQVGRTPRELVTGAQMNLEQQRVNVLGYILTHADHCIPPYIQHYLKGGYAKCAAS